MDAFLFSALFCGVTTLASKSFMVDPYRYTISYKEFVRESGATRFSIDINGDNRSDLFVSAQDGSGNAGRMYFVFFTSKEQYVYGGEIFLHPLAFQIMKSKHHGVSDIFVYRRNSSDNGNLEEYHFNGTQFEMIASSAVKAVDLDKKLQATKIEVINAGPEVKW